MFELTFTPVNEQARAKLGISHAEYALCNYVEVWAAHPENKMPGFCERTLDQKAAFIMMTPRGITKMQNRLIEIGLLEKSPVGGFVRPTKAWFKTVKFTQNQEFADKPNKEQSSYKQGTKFLQTGNKVPTHNYISINNKYKDKGAAKKESSFSSKEEAFEMSTPAPPPNPYGSLQDPLAHIDGFAIDHSILEAFSLVNKIPAEKFHEYIKAFRAEVKATGETYANLPALRRHYLNWARIRHERETKKTSETPRHFGGGRRQEMPGAAQSYDESKANFG